MKKKKVRLKLFYRIIVVIVLFVLSILDGLFLVNKFNNSNISYNEKSDISYKVFIKDNEYFKEDFLEEGNTYISSLIDYFLANFSYQNNLSEVVHYDGRYNVTADLVIYSSDNNSKPVMTKSYTLLDDISFKGSSNEIYLDVNNQVINYDSYNSIVKNIKKEITPSAVLKVNFNCEYNVNNSNMLDKEVIKSTSSLEIPISTKTVNVNIVKSNLDSVNYINKKSSINYFDVLLFLVLVVFFMVSLLGMIYYIFSKKDNKSRYEKELSRILREYDRMITESKDRVVFSDDITLINVNSFDELIDVHDNLSIPIIYSKIDDDSSEFIIKNNNDVYRFVLENED